MPRRRRGTGLQGAGSAPAELVDPEHRVWGSVRSTEAWYVSVGVRVHEPSNDGPYSRHRQAVGAWARDKGLVRYYGENLTAFPDWELLRAAGIPAANGRAMQERFRRINA